MILVKLKASTNYEISDELEMPLSSVCGRVQRTTRIKLGRKFWPD